jgi:phosphatidate cytidylyltransferase
MLGTRLITGFVLAGVLVAVLVLDELLAPWFPLWLVVCLVVTGAAALELVGLLNQTSARPSANTVLGGVVALVLANWAPHILARLHHLPHLADRLAYDPMTPIHALGWPMLTFVAVVMTTFVAQSAQFQRPGVTMATISGTVLAVAYVGVLGSFVIQTRWLDGPYHGVVPLAYLFVAAKGADTGAYTLGRLAGRHKLWPRLSPNKTVEGAIGGMVFAVGGALLVTAIARALPHAPGLTWGAALAYGLIVGAAAQLGDLMESMIKRDCSRKDASAAVPGFGGVLDVLDSLLFAGPVSFAFWLTVGA